MLFLFIIFIILLLFSAFFSSTETVFYLSNEKIKKQFIKVNQDTFLVFILLSNTIVNIFIGITSEKIFSENLFKGKPIILSIGITTFILLFFGEIIPKRLSLIIYPLINKHSLYLMQKWIDFIRFFEKIINFFIKPLHNVDKEDKSFSVKEIKNVLNDGITRGYFNPTQAVLISNLISQSLSTVKDNIIHYSELPIITLSMSVNEVFELINKSNFHKIPVISKNMKDIYGYVSKGDLIGYIVENKKNESYDIKKIIKPLDMIYEYESIETAIHRFIEKSETILGVYDEHFQYCGIIDYYKLIDNMMFGFSNELAKKFPFIVNANTPCRTLYYNYNIHLDEKDMNFKLSEIVLDKLGDIPKEGEYIVYTDYKFIISKMKNKKILLITIDRAN